MKQTTAILFHLLIITLSFGQDFSIISQRTIGGTGDEDGLIFPNPYNSDEYFLIGHSYSGISGDKTEASRGMNDAWIAKLDGDFNVLWDKTYGGSLLDAVTSSLILEDKIVVATYSNSVQSGDKTMELFGSTNIWMLCLDHSGDILWQAQYGGSGEEIYPKVLPYTDTTFLMFCSSDSPISGNKTIMEPGIGDHVWIVEISYANGEIIQQKGIYTEDYTDKFLSITRTLDNHYLLSIQAETGIRADKTDYGHGSIDVWLVELDEDLNIVRSKCFGGDNWDYWGSIYETNEHYYMTATSQSGISGVKTEEVYGIQDIWLVKMDKNFNIIWDKSIGGMGFDAGSGAFINDNGKIVLYGGSKSPANGNKTSPYYGGQDLWIVLLSQNGDLLEQFTVGGNADDFGVVIPHPTDPSKLLFSATSSSPAGTGNKTASRIGGTDVWVGVIDASNVLEITNVEVNDVILFPNPVSEILTIHFSGTANVWLTDLSGKQITDLYFATEEVIIPVTDLSKGTYILHLQTQSERFTKKVVIL